MRVTKIPLLLLITAVVLGQSAATAGPRGMQRYVDNHEMTLENAVGRAKKQYNGRVISAETDRRNGKGTHNIRILTEDGRVRRLRYDQQTGEYIRPPRKR